MVDQNRCLRDIVCKNHTKCGLFDSDSYEIIFFSQMLKETIKKIRKCKNNLIKMLISVFSRLFKEDPEKSKKWNID